MSCPRLKKAATPSGLKLEVCRKAYGDCREKCGGAIAQLLGSIEDPLPDNAAMAMLDWLATEHQDPEKEHWQIQAGGGKAYYDGNIYDNGINTDRGKAVSTIGDLILKDSTYIKRFETTLARVIQNRARLCAPAPRGRCVPSHTTISQLAYPSFYR